MQNYLSNLSVVLILLVNVSNISFSQTNTQNYIYSRKMLDANASQSIQSIQYYDGLGRPFMSVQKGITPSGSNLHTLQEYDVVGRESKTWLPATSTADYMLPTQLSGSNHLLYNDSRAYIEPIYEASPLNRILRQYGPGNNWATHPVATAYLRNRTTVELSSKLYYVTDSDELSQRGIYAANQLYVTKTTDEDGNSSYSFVDKQGRLLLVRQMKGEEPHDTYYVYDDYGNKRFVLPPAYQDNPDIGLYAYQYKFDHRNRCIEKILPGCQPIKYVYDQTDKLTLSQDGVQRLNAEWTFYLYDALNRLTVQGVCKNVDVSSVPKMEVTCSFDRGPTGLATPFGIGGCGYSSNLDLSSYTLHKANYFDNYDFLCLPSFEDRSKYPLSSISAIGFQTGSMVTMFGNTTKHLCSATYYDTKGRPVREISQNHLGGYETTVTDYTFTSKPSSLQHVHSATGKATHTETYTYTYDHADRLKIVKHQLDDNTVVTLAEHTYDELGRLKNKSLHASGSNIVTYNYNIRNWLTNVNSSKFQQTLSYESGSGTRCYNGNISSMSWRTNGENLSRRYVFSYDGLSRLAKADYVESNPLGQVSGPYNTAYTYDKMGNMTSLKRNGFSVRPGRFTTIDDLTIEHSGNQLKRISDRATGNNPLYNEAFNFVDGVDEPMEYEYDSNGNLIKDLNKGITKIDYNAFNLPDEITLSDQRYINYNYSADGVLRRKEHYYTEATSVIIPMPGIDPDLEDSIEPWPGTKPDRPIAGGGIVQLSSSDAGQDNSASAVFSESQVNPEIAVDAGDAIPSFYKGYVSSDYCSNMIYEKGKLIRILTGEGYITFSGNIPTYHYYLKDHQGNNRVVLQADGTVEQVNHYYPYGGLFGESTNGGRQPYKYGGKEFDRMHGLDWYDFGARMKDDWSFTTIDPLCEKYYSISPYVYCGDNPVNRVDPDGTTDYKLTSLGQVIRIGKKDSNPDRLFSNKKSIVVNDKKLLDGLTKNMGGDVNCRSYYQSTENIRDAVAVFKFAADETNKEWKLDIYKSEDNQKIAVVATDMKPDAVGLTDLYNNDNAKVKGLQKVIDIHSHPDENGTKGGSSGDMKTANPNGKDAVYHKQTKTIFEYDKSNSSTKSVKINSTEELYKYVNK